MKSWIRSLTILGMAVLMQAAHGQPAGDKVVRIFHGGGAGGNADLIARALVPLLEEQLDESVVVEARPGAGQTIGMMAAARALADGRTLAMLNAGISVQSALNRKLPYSLTRDFVPVGMLSRFPFVILVRQDSPIKNIKDLTEAARGNPDNFTYGTIGAGTSQNMVGELVNSTAGIRMLHVPYRSASGPVTDLLGGRIDAVVDSLTATMGQIKAGSVRALAVSSLQRWPGLADVPALSETMPGFDVTSWTGLAVPAATPTNVVERLERAVGRAATSERFAEQIRRFGSEPYLMGTSEMKNYIQEEVARWAAVAEKANIIIAE